ncbi:hypothetical protein lerEdw1_018055, partial [Lerista edwardsae]
DVKRTVTPASIAISAQSVKMGFTYTVESALKTALNGWSPTITLWNATILVSKPWLLASEGQLRVLPTCKTTEPIHLISLLQCIVKLVNGANGAIVQRKGKHVASKEEMKQGSEKSCNFLTQRATHVHIRLRPENVLYKKRNAREENKVLFFPSMT